jgi:filamentous hemagglutinin family protein
MIHNWRSHGIFWMAGLALASPAQAQIVPDGTLPTNSSVAPGCITCTIEGGTVRGNTNLFHSFQRFDVPTGGAAYFNQAAGIQNILTRVTGALGSNIDGLIRTNPGANLFLINPNGILFGPNASLAVGGSFVATTANAIQFGDRGFFSASVPTPPAPLLTINPSAFVFNQLNQGQIVVRSQAPAGLNPYSNPTTGLRVPDGQSLLLVGGPVTLDGGNLRAYSGRVELAGLAAPGRIDLVGDFAPGGGSRLRLQVPADAIRADVSLNSAAISSFNATGGELGLYGHTLRVADSVLFGGLSLGTGAGVAQAGDIVLDATDSILWGPGSIINANVDAGAIGNGGQIVLRAGNRVVLDGQTDATGSGGAITASLEQGSVGRAGTIQVTTGSLELLNGALLSSSSFGQGAPGSVVIQARDRVVLAGTDRNGFASTITSAINGGISRDAPGIIQIITGSLRLAGGAQIATGNAGGQGRGSAIQIQARGAVDITQRSLISSQVQSGGVGDGGAIEIKAGALSLLSGGQINASIRGTEQFAQASRGNGGAIDLTIRGALTLDQFGSQITSGLGFAAVGNAGAITIQAGSLRISDRASIGSDSFGEGNAGNITIQVETEIELDRSQIGSSISVWPGASSFNRSLGRGGDLRLQAPTLSLVNGTSLTAASNGRGDAGRIVIAGETLTLDNASIVTSLAQQGRGNAGEIQIEIRDAVRLQNRANIQSALFSGRGRGGDIRLNAGTLSLVNALGIFSATDGQGDAGTITLNLRDRLFVQNSLIASSVASNGQGNGGDLRIHTGSLALTNGGQLNAETTGRGNAGTILIHANDAISIAGISPNRTIFSGILNTVEATGQGHGGNTRISTRSLTLGNDAAISASTLGNGNAGTIEITATDAISISNANSTTAQNSGIYVGSGTTGSTGNITITAPRLTIRDRGVISANSNSVNGGNITLNLQEYLLLRRGGSLSTNAGTAQQGGDGGNITIHLPKGFLVAVLNENSDISANAFSGNGGNVNITAQGIYGIQFQPRLTPWSDITASSTFGLSGVVTVTTLGVDPNRGLVPLPNRFIDATTQFDPRCGYGLKDIRRSRFVYTGRGGIAPSPTEALLPELETEQWVVAGGVAETAAEARKEARQAGVDRSAVNPIEPTRSQPIVEARRIQVDRTGAIWLVADTAFSQDAAFPQPDCAPLSDADLGGF